MRSTFWLLPLIILFNLKVVFSTNISTGQTESTPIETDETNKIGHDFLVSTTITNKHIWRAIVAGTSPCIEPIITWSYGKINVSAWAAYALDNSYKEFDLFATYDSKYFQFGFYDYYCPVAGSISNDFTEFKKSETKHSFELQTVFKGTKKLPVQLTTACIIGGDDLDKNEKQLYSSYLELAYSLSVKENLINIEIGMTPAKGLYSNNASVFNYGLSVERNIKVNKDWSIPSIYKVVYNKETKDVFLSVSFTIG